MIFSPMFNTIKTRLSIAPLTIAPFSWGWDSNPSVPLIFHYLFPPHKQTLPMLSLRPTKPPYSLSRFNTSNAMINTWYRTSFRLETKSGYICRRSIQTLFSFHFLSSAYHLYAIDESNYLSPYVKVLIVSPQYGLRFFSSSILALYHFPHE
jgi:hypothetical protein